MRFTQKKEIRYLNEQQIRKIKDHSMSVDDLKREVNKLRGFKKTLVVEIEEEDKTSEIEKVRSSFKGLKLGTSSLKMRDDLKLSILQEQKQLLNKGFLDS